MGREWLMQRGRTRGGPASPPGPPEPRASASRASVAASKSLARRGEAAGRREAPCAGEIGHAGGVRVSSGPAAGAHPPLKDAGASARRRRRSASGDARCGGGGSCGRVAKGAASRTPRSDLRAAVKARPRQSALRHHASALATRNKRRRAHPQREDEARAAARLAAARHTAARGPADRIARALLVCIRGADRGRSAVAS